MFITGPLLITALLSLKRQPCINNYIIIIITEPEKEKERLKNEHLPVQEYDNQEDNSRY